MDQITELLKLATAIVALVSELIKIHPTERRCQRRSKRRARKRKR